MLEFRFRLSERNKPGAEMEPIPALISLPAPQETEAEKSQVTQAEAERVRALEAELSRLKAT